MEAADPTGVVNTVRAAVPDESPAPPSSSSPREAPAPAPVDNDSDPTLASASSSTTRQVSGLVEPVRRKASETVTATGERTAHVVKAQAPVHAAVETLKRSPLTAQIAKAAGSLTGIAVPLRKTVAPLLNSLIAPAAATLFPSFGAAAGAPSGDPLGVDDPSLLRPLRLQGAAGVQPVEDGLGFIGLERSSGLPVLTSADRNRPGSGQALTPSSPPVGGLAFTATDDFKAPGSPNVPMPAPESPEAAAPASGGAFFTPLAALLALLALAAPATRRRPGEVPDFAAPTPFVCALERPG